MSALGLAALGLAAFFALVVMVVFPNVRSTVLQMVVGMFILLLGLTLVGMLVIAITNVNLDPHIRQGAVMLTRHRIVDFFTLLPGERYTVRSVDYKDTDGDNQDEWVVFYQFDMADGRSPYAGVVYDSDRGGPPVLFPYRLLPPDRDYLSEAAIWLELKDIVKLGEAQPAPELLVYGSAGGLNTDLTIFRHFSNSLPWEFPRDDPRRYQVIGSFRGDGDIAFDPNDNSVTVINRAGYDRSQLAVKTVYRLDEARGSYMNPSDPQQLDAPISSRVVFAFGMPSDILSTPYPEKLVLGFYQTLDEKPTSIEPKEFLTGKALMEYEQGNLAYFGFDGVTGKVTDVDEVKITQLSYAPEVEKFDPSVTVLGEEPRFLTVSVAFEAKMGKQTTQTLEPIHWVTTLVKGKWKIDHRL